MLPSGEKVRDNTIIKSLGSGSFGAVYAVNNPRFDFPVALKISSSTHGSDEENRFLQENVILHRLHNPSKHSQIVFPLSGNEKQDLYIYYLMELSDYNLESFTLANYNLSTIDKISLFKKICGGIKHAHQTGIVHRDLWWNNILVNEADDIEIKLCDFGRAKDYNLEPLTYLESPCVGHYYVRSPELFFLIHDNSDPSLSKAGDIYALGILLSFLFNGSPIIYWPKLMGDIMNYLDKTKTTNLKLKSLSEKKQIYLNWLEQKQSHSYEDLKVSLVDYALTTSINTIIMKLCNIDYSKRYASVEDLEKDLNSLNL